MNARFHAFVWWNFSAFAISSQMLNDAPLFLTFSVFFLLKNKKGLKKNQDPALNSSCKALQKKRKKKKNWVIEKPNNAVHAKQSECVGKKRSILALCKINAAFYVWGVSDFAVFCWKAVIRGWRVGHIHGNGWIYHVSQWFEWSKKMCVNDIGTKVVFNKKKKVLPFALLFFSWISTLKR